MTILKKSIKHFEGLQKRYTTQHNGKMCQFVACALEAMTRQLVNENDETTLDVIKHNTSLEMAYFIEKMHDYIEEGKFKTTNDIQDYLDERPIVQYEEPEYKELEPPYEDEI